MIRTNVFVLLVGLALAAGCTETTPEKADANRPASLSDAIARLDEINGTIKAAFDAGKPHDCDDALHEGADILSVLVNVAKDEGKLDAAGVDSVTKLSAELMRQLGKIHDGFHDEHAHDDHAHDDHAHDDHAHDDHAHDDHAHDDHAHDDHAHDDHAQASGNVYDSVAAEINAALEALREIANGTSAAP